MIDDLGPPLQLGVLLRALDKHAVEFVIIGGVAGLAHGSAYPTYDLDVVYAHEEPNLKRMAAALRELDVKLRGAPPGLPFQVDAETLANGSNFTFVGDFGRFDILGQVDGVRNYEDLRTAAVTERVEGVTVRIASIDHLISMKRAANRPKDQLMVEEYLVIADEEQRQREAGD